jgi:hypothetical protein
MINSNLIGGFLFGTIFFNGKIIRSAIEAGLHQVLGNFYAIPVSGSVRMVWLTSVNDEGTLPR